MRLPPLEVLATYPPPNYVNPENRGPSIFIANAIFFPFVSAIVALRVYTRVRISSSYGWDDTLIMLSLLFAIAFTFVSLVVTVKYGWDRHVWDLKLNKISLGLKTFLITQCLFATACMLNKLSMLVLTLRIMLHGTGPLRNIIIGAMISVVVSNVVYVLVTIFQCNPISDAWTLSFAPQKCTDEHVRLLASGIINTIADFVVVMLPIPVFMQLQLHRRQRIMVILLFAVGFMVCFAGIGRTVYTYYLTAGNDKTWDAYPVGVASSIELYVGIACASVPPLKPFFSRYAPKFLSSTSSRSTQDSSLSRRKYSEGGDPSARRPSAAQGHAIQFRDLTEAGKPRPQTRPIGENGFDSVTHINRPSSSRTNISSFNESCPPSPTRIHHQAMQQSSSDTQLPSENDAVPKQSKPEGSHWLGSGGETESADDRLVCLYRHSRGDITVIDTTRAQAN